MNSGINWVKLRPSFFHPYLFMNEYLYIDNDEYEIEKVWGYKPRPPRF